MKIENEMKYECVKEALIRWVLGTDGQDGATCELLGVIPWNDELETLICWDDVYDEINDSFGCRTDENNKWWDAGSILTNADELERFHNFITEKTKKVMSVYQGIIDRAIALNKTKFEIIVQKFVGVVDNVAQYEPTYHYYGNNLTSLVNKVYDELQVSNWLRDDFMDSVHYGCYNNSHTAFKTKDSNGYNFHLEVKRND